MAKGYWVVTYRKIINEVAFKRYAERAPSIVQSQGGRFLVRGMASEAHEAGLMQRVVVIEFESLAKARATHDSAEYQAVLKELAGNAVERDLRIIEGLD